MNIDINGTEHTTLAYIDTYGSGAFAAVVSRQDNEHPFEVYDTANSSGKWVWCASFELKSDAIKLVAEKALMKLT